jgi:hypothetical protein
MPKAAKLSDIWGNTMSIPVDTGDHNTGGWDADAFDRGTDPVLRIFSPEQARQLVDYQGDDQLRQRIDELADKSCAGALSPSERAEYEGYVRANKFVATLQAQARKLLVNAKQE